MRVVSECDSVPGDIVSVHSKRMGKVTSDRRSVKGERSEQLWPVDVVLTRGSVVVDDVHRRVRPSEERCT